MSAKTWLIDAGHGGMIEGVYQTSGKQYTHDDGTTIYEGEFNRKVRMKLSDLLDEACIDYIYVNTGNDDMPLNERTDIANKYHNQFGNCIYLSLHGNGGGGSGFEVYTTKGNTYSDKVAEIWIDKMVLEFPGEKNRGHKEANFYVIKRTDCPAVLVENFFMDTYEDCLLMLSEEGQNKMANALYQMILHIENLLK